MLTMNNEELYRDMDDLNFAINKLKFVLNKLDIQKASLDEKQEKYNRLKAENIELNLKIIAAQKQNFEKARSENQNAREMTEFDSRMKSNLSPSTSSYEFYATTSASLHKYTISNSNPFIERNEIAEFENVANLDLISDGINRHSLKADDAVIGITTKASETMSVIKKHTSKCDSSTKSGVVSVKVPSQCSVGSSYSSNPTILAGQKSRSILVTENMQPFLTHTELKSFFGQYGQIVNITEIPQSKSRRLLFLKFKTFEAAERSLGKRVIGKRIVNARLAKDF